MLISMHNVFFYLDVDARRSATRSRQERLGALVAPPEEKLPERSLSRTRRGITSMPSRGGGLWRFRSRRSSSRGGRGGSTPTARPWSTGAGGSPTREFFERCDRWSSASAAAGRRAGRPRRDHRLELARPPRGLLRGAADRRRARPDQLPAGGRRRRLHPGAQRRPRRLRLRRRRRALVGPDPREDSRRSSSVVAFDGPARRAGSTTRRELPRADRRASTGRRQLDERDLLSLNYTSGTTARPKGVMITHRNAYTNVVGHAAPPPHERSRIATSGRCRCSTPTAGRSSGR